jgi:hypothetical protein
VTTRTAGGRATVAYAPLQRPRRLVLAFLVFAILAGQMQSIAEVLFPSLALTSFVDDVFVLLALVLSAPALVRAPGGTVLAIFLWLASLGLAAYYSVTSLGFASEEIIFMYRQVAMPALIMLIGLALRPSEWRFLGSLVILVGLVNVLYVIYELTFGRPIDPVAIAESQGEYVGYYNGSDIFTGAAFERAGGLVLNPPIAGIFLATGLVVAAHRRGLRYRWPILLCLAAATWVTGSRGGLLVAAVGVALPWAARRFNAWVAVVVMIIVATPFAIEISTHKGSGRHAAGLVQGLIDAATNPLGVGFGFVGNHRPEEVDSQVGESLLGIAFSSAGVITIALILALVFRLLVNLNRDGERAWISALAAGGLFAALFSETAGSVDGTVAIWLAAGFALSRSRPNFVASRKH